MADPKVTTLYDDNPNNITFIPLDQWEEVVPPTDVFTTLKTNKAGAKASISFYGTKIIVVGTISNLGLAPSSSYLLDNSPQYFFSHTNYVSQHSMLLYESPVVPLAQHTLNITNLIENAFLYLDYFLVYGNIEVPQSTQSPSLGSTAISTTTSIPSSSILSAYNQSQPQPQPQPYSSSSVGTSSPTIIIPSDPASTASSNSVVSPPSTRTKIIGAVFGCLGIFALMGMGIFLIKRRRKRNNYLKAPSAMYQNSTTKLEFRNYDEKH